MTKHHLYEFASLVRSPEFQHKALYIMFSIALAGGNNSVEGLKAISQNINLFNEFEIQLDGQVLEGVAQTILSDSATDRQLKVISYVSEICSSHEIRQFLKSDLETIIDSDGKICHAELTAYRNIQAQLI